MGDGVGDGVGDVATVGCVCNGCVCVNVWVSCKGKQKTHS